MIFGHYISNSCSKDRRRTLKFRTKTILGIGLIETILLVILIISSISFLNRSNDEHIQNRAETTVSLFAASTKDAVLSTDLDSLQSFVDELLSTKDVVYVRIVGDTTILAQGGEAQALNKPFKKDTSLQSITDNIFDTSAVIQESGYQFGHIELGLSVSSTTQLISEAWKWATGIAIIEILLVAFFSYVLGAYLTRQLHRLTDASKTIGIEGPGYQIEVKGNDEIAELSQSFNQMSKNLSDTYKQLNSSAQEYRSMAEKLAESDAKKSNMLSTALDGIITIDSNGIIEEFNEAAQIIFGFSKQEALGKNIGDLIIPEGHRAAHKNGMEHWKLTGDAPILGQRFETTAIRKGGEEFPIELAITAVEAKNSTFFTGFIRDITKQKQADLELRMAASAFDAHEGIFITDNNATIIRINKAFSKITGYSSSEAIGAKPAEIFKSGKHDKTFYEKMWHELLHNGRWEGEIYNRRKNGEIYPEWLGISALRDSEGRIINFVAHFIDISQRKKFEEDLVSARHKAESANIAKSQFLAAMSHEIRTPLNGVIGMTDLLLRSETQPKKQHMLRTANHSAHILLEIIKNILDFSKIESGELSLELIPVSISKIIEETCEILAPVAQQKQVKLIVYIDPEINLRVLSDSVRLHQILFNLCSNAIKFTHTDANKDGRVVLRAESAEINRETAYLKLRICIEDNGIGIRKETLERIFEPFTQAELSTTRQYGGSGLGLAITQRIVEAMKGNISVESLHGTGTRFNVELPLKLLPDEDKQAPQLSEIRVLVVESYSPLDQYLLEYLRQQKAEVTLFRNLEKARQGVMLSYQNNKPFDVIIIGTAWKQKLQLEWAVSLKNQLHTEEVQFILLGDTLKQPNESSPGIGYLNAFPLLPSTLISNVLSATRHEPVINTSPPLKSGEQEPAGQVKMQSDVSLLLAEDNTVNQDVIKLQLHELGFQVDIASDGMEAMEMYRQQHYDLVLTDCHMPNMDGYQLTREIRKLSGQKGQVPIIAITADALAEEDKYWLEVGMNEYLSKPLKVDSLKAILSRYIPLTEIDEMEHNVGTLNEEDSESIGKDIVFDDSALNKLVGNLSGNVRNKLLKKFLQTSEDGVALIIQAWDQNEHERIQREAHKLKSSASAIGAFKLSKTCGLLETGCIQKDLSAIKQKVAVIREQFDEVKQMVKNTLSDR